VPQWVYADHAFPCGSRGYGQTYLFHTHQQLSIHIRETAALVEWYLVALSLCQSAKACVNVFTVNKLNARSLVSWNRTFSQTCRNTALETETSVQSNLIKTASPPHTHHWVVSQSINQFICYKQLTESLKTVHWAWKSCRIVRHYSAVTIAL